jgi:hypothetical protein
MATHALSGDSPRLFGDITIRPHGKNWQASASVLAPWLVAVDGVLGVQTEQPWVGGIGATPNAALDALRLSIGMIMLQASLLEGA